MGWGLGVWELRRFFLPVLTPVSMKEFEQSRFELLF